MFIKKRPNRCKNRGKFADRRFWRIIEERANNPILLDKMRKEARCFLYPDK